MAFEILVVDDSAVTRSLIRKTLSYAHIPFVRCLEAADGREALEILDEHWVDLVLADLNMPVMSGQELLRIMRDSRQLADVPVIIVTSESLSQEQVESEWRAAAYVRKPFTPEEIRDAIASLVGADEQTSKPQWLLEQFANVLETMAFMFIEPQPDNEPTATTADFLRGRISFGGAVSGEMSLSLPLPLAVRMAAGALGIEPDDPVAAEHASDIVGELLNITCGHVSESLAGGAGVDCGPPAVTQHESADWADLTAEPTAAPGLVEGQPVVVGLRVR